MSDPDETVYMPGAVPARRSVIEAKRAERLIELQRAREWMAAAITDGWTCERTYGPESTDDHFRLRRDDFVAHVMVRETSTIGWQLPEVAVNLWGRGGIEGIKTPWPYSWEAITANYCGHDLEHIAKVGNCLNRYRCRKCGETMDIDSSD